ncbi:MAG: PAS domain S-box protein, partial [Proteobacteria bacterium]|nr:PAS domain S-box protein [Pseudomonadota bacterium]
MSVHIVKQDPVDFSTPLPLVARQKILIVDDRRENLFALRKTLAGVDAEIIEATSGNQALAASLDHRFAVAILDIMMPGMNGYELAEHLRGDEKTQVIPIVFLTASFADEQHMFQGYEAGAIDYIVKPYEPEVLVAKVKVFLELDRHKQALQIHRDRLETLVAERTAMLTERVKEVRCLYAISSLVAQPCESIDESMRAAVGHIPAGWQYPEITRARILFEGREFASEDFRDAPWRQSADIVLGGEVVGRVDVCYVEERPESDEGPFLEEERELVDDIARQLGVMIQRDKAVARERHLSAVLISIRNVNQLIVKEKQRDRLLQAACDNLTSSRGFQGAWIVLTNSRSEHVDGAQSGFPDTAFALLMDRLRKGERPAYCISGLTGQGMMVIEDCVSRCLDCPLADPAGENGALIAELRHGDRQYGYLGVSVPMQFAASEEEVSLLGEIAGDIGFALHGIEMEEARRKSEDIMRAIFRSASDGILLADAETRRFVTANEALCRMLGYSEEEILGLSVADIHPAEGLPRVMAAFEKQLRGEITLASGIPVMRKDGGIFLADVSAAPIELNGRSHLLGIFRDITERRAAEQRIEHLNRLLRAIRDVNQLIIHEPDQETLIRQGSRLLVDNRGFSSALIVLTGENDQPVLWSHSGLESASELVDTMFERGELPPCCERARSAKGVVLIQDRQGVCGPCPMGFSCAEIDSLCVRLVHGGKFFGYISAALEAGLGLDPEERHLFAEMADDLTFALHTREMNRAREEGERERKSLEGQLLQAQKMESVGRLAGGVAHDFNNMLSVIIGNAELALSKIKPGDPILDNIQEIFKAGKRSADLTRQLLAFARKQTISPIMLDLNKTVEGMLKLLRRLLGEDIDILWKPCSNPWAVKMDPAQIDQIMANLCVNARDAIAGVGKVTIETTNITFDTRYCAKHADSIPGDYVLLAVSDDGIGMDQATMDKIFEPFFTTKKEGKGTGLGLAMVFGIVKQNNGFINIYSEPGQGTTFKIYLPR